jgi:phage baseplate assembly protein W
MAIVRQTAQDTLQSKQPELFSDFLTDFDSHPVKKDLVKYTNENAVKQSIKSLVLTNRGERFFNYSLGCDVRTMLFEQLTPATELVVADLIKTTIENYEPRARVIDVAASGDYDTGTVFVTIVFSIINKQEPITLELILDRIR